VVEKAIAKLERKSCLSAPLRPTHCTLSSHLISFPNPPIQFNFSTTYSSSHSI
jgi:hypothetical protein